VAEAPNDFYEIDPALRAAISSQEYHAAISSLARAANAPMIVGDIAFDADPQVKRGYDQFNSADFIAPDGRIVDATTRCISSRSANMFPTRNCSSLPGACCKTWVYSTPESTGRCFPPANIAMAPLSATSRSLRRDAPVCADGADVLVNISDDGWYGDTSAAWEHLNMVRMRAIENHRWVLRATNTGVTAAIDPYGRVVTSAPRHRRTSLRVGFDYEHDITFYSAHGIYSRTSARYRSGRFGVGVVAQDDLGNIAQGQCVALRGIISGLHTTTELAFPSRSPRPSSPGRP